VPTPERRSLGAQFIESPDYQAFIKAQMHRRAGSWVSPTMELHATTLDSSAGSGGPLILPQQIPGILPLLFKRLTVSDLLPKGTTSSNALLYLKEKTFTNAAAAVAEGAAKPESALVFEQATSPVQKIAHWLPVTEEMLEDYPAIRSYIDARLRLGLDLTKEDEELNGTGVAPHLMGLMNVVGQSAAVVRGTDSNADAIFRQITAITVGALVAPDAIVMNPVNWQSIQLTKNANGNYLGAGPWNSPQPPTLWGLPVAVTPSIVANTSLVGGFSMGAQEFTKGGVRVEVSNSHQDFFVKNLIAIRAEERLALCIYRPAAFGKVTGLN
jgi:HK97 family phage major capsid protein